VAGITLVLVLFIPHVDRDPSLKSCIVTSSTAYSDYQAFCQAFGDDEHLLIAITSDGDIIDRHFLKSLISKTARLSQIKGVAEVLSIGNLQLLQRRDGQLGNFPVLPSEEGKVRLPSASTLASLRKAFPLMDLLVSHDLKTVGLLVRLQEDSKFDPEAVDRILADLERTVKDGLSSHWSVRIIGSAKIRQAIMRNALVTAIVFGCLCTVICAAVTFHLLKSLKVMAMAIGILSLSGIWLLGLMGLFGIPLNSNTSPSFGLLFVIALEIIIHLVVRYNQFHEWEPDRIKAVKETVAYLARPFLISIATTMAGFGATMITSIPLVFYFGLTMALGVTVFFALAMILMPSLMASGASFDLTLPGKTTEDWFSRGIEKVKTTVGRYSRAIIIAAALFSLFMLLGTSRIETNPQFLRLLGESTLELREVRFVERQLTPVSTLELVLKAQGAAFQKPEMPEVVSTDSLRSMLEHVSHLLQGDPALPDPTLKKSGLFRQILFMMELSPEGKNLLYRYLSEDYSQLRVQIRIRNSPKASILRTIAEVRSVAASVMEDAVRPLVTGELAVVAQQSEELIQSQLYSLLFALGIITVLMMIQMGTPRFGLISILPNIPPVLTVFGMMGWLGIALDGMTVSAATVAVGLAVDNTIQFIAQLKREMKRNPQEDVSKAIFTAYDLAARPMASWTLVTLLGFLALIVTPYQAAMWFGLLVSSALLVGMLGDFVLLQSIILAFPSVRRLLARQIRKEIEWERAREP
jgi:predicted RND superfamily exporter protein